MFDRIEHHSHRTLGRTQVTITENKAPTDDSVRLLAEMQEAARKSVVDAYPLESNLISGVVDKYENVISGEDCLRAIFEINGRRLEARASSPVYKRKTHGEIELWVALRDEIAKTIANELVMDMGKFR